MLTYDSVAQMNPLDVERMNTTAPMWNLIDIGEEEIGKGRICFLIHIYSYFYSSR